MRILYFSFVELDIPIACRTHTLGVLKGFANQGCQVDALIPRPTKIFPQIPGVRFFYLWPWQFSPIGIVWVKLLCGLMMLWLCLKNRYDFIYVRELQLNPGPRLCSKAFKIPLYIEINDLLVPSLSNAGAHPGFVSLIARHQQMDCRQASGLIVPSVPMRQWLVDHYRLEPTKVHLVLNGADRPAEHPSTKREARGRLGIPQDCFCVGFVGNLYGRYDFLAVLPKKDRLEIRFALSRILDTPRLKQSVPVSATKHKNCIDLHTKEEVDGELMGWVKEAYTLK